MVYKHTLVQTLLDFLLPTLASLTPHGHTALLPSSGCLNAHQDPQQHKLPDTEEMEFAFDSTETFHPPSPPPGTRRSIRERPPQKTANAAAVDASTSSSSASKRPCRASFLLSTPQQVNMDSSLYGPTARNFDLNLVALGIPAAAASNMMMMMAANHSTTVNNHVALGILASPLYMSMPAYPFQPDAEPASSSSLPSQVDGLLDMDTAADNVGLSRDTIDDLFVDQLLWGISCTTTTIDDGHEEETVEREDALMALLLQEARTNIAPMMDLMEERTPTMPSSSSRCPPSTTSTTGGAMI